MLSIKQRLHLVAVSFGLFVCYSIFGILQERIFKRGYGNDGGQLFTFSVIFVFCQCLFYSVFAKILMIRAVILMTRNQKPNETHQGFFAFTAVFYVVALVTSNTALQFISYPSQVIGKALKPIPTMIFGFWVGGKTYAIRKYFFVLLIVTGAIMFLYKPVTASLKGSSHWGFVLVGISLLMNGCMAGVQEKMRSVVRPSPLNLMLFLNSWSSIFMIVLVLASGELKGFVTFCIEHPEIVVQISLILVVGGCGQLFTCTMITNYGVVPCCLVLTVRKFFNVLFSALYYGNALTLQQWLATALIFTSLLADSVLSVTFSKGERTVDVTNSDTNSDGMANVDKINESEHVIMPV